MRIFAVLLPLAVVSLVAPSPARSAPLRHSSVSPRLKNATDEGPAPRSERHRVVVGLALRDRAALEAFLADVQDPVSPRYRQFLTQEEFDSRYAPTPDDEAAVVDHLRAAGVKVTERAANRLIVTGVGSVAALERAFGVAIHTVRVGGKAHYAAVQEPSLPAALAHAVTGVVGLDDLATMRPHVRTVGPAAAPRAALGANCCHLSPNDLAVLYDNSSAYPGSGQTIVIAGAYAWRDTDVSAFSTQWGLPQLPAGSGQVCTGPSRSLGCRFSNQNSIEISLDVEYSHGTAPAARILNYMAASTSFADFTTMYNRIVTDHPGNVVSTSWGACEAGVSQATQLTDDAIFANANAIGQAWFAASGDSGSRDCGTTLTVDNPANSPHVIGVGGTTPTCSGGMTPGSPGCTGYGSETGWPGSGGGISNLFARPAFQAGCGVPPGSQRLVPDVALEADTSPGNYVAHGGSWYIVGGTSGGAPQWAGLASQVDQRTGGGGLGNPGGLLYGLCATSAFHDVMDGTNGDYDAGPGFDLVTGLGSFDATQLLAAAGGSATTTTTSTSAPTSSSTSTTSSAAPSSTSTTAAATTSTTSTTLGGSCQPAGSSCTTAGDCCSGTCRGKPGNRTCK